MVGDLAAIGGIHRPRRRAHIAGGIHVIPPEQIGAGEGGIAAARGLPHPPPLYDAASRPAQPSFCETAKASDGHEFKRRGVRRPLTTIATSDIPSAIHGHLRLSGLLYGRCFRSYRSRPSRHPYASRKDKASPLPVFHR